LQFSTKRTLEVVVVVVVDVTAIGASPISSIMPEGCKYYIFPNKRINTKK
jgi:hypothetical protein